MSRPLKWEFPGGKIKPGETPAECIRREIREELDLTVQPIAIWSGSRHRYHDMAILLIPLTCRIVGGKLKRREHERAGWFAPDRLPALDWAEADKPVLARYLRRRSGSRRHPPGGKLTPPPCPRASRARSHQRGAKLWRAGY